MSNKSSQPLSDALKPFVAPFRVDGTSEFHLKSHTTGEKGGLDKDGGEKIIEANRKRLNDFQEKLYAQDRWSMLLVFQGMDAAGKDSAIKSIFDGVNPQGCEVTSFKQPSTLELNHDFLWRSMIALPQRGRIGIFNRSYYEECLVTRVHPDLLAKEKIPPRLVTKNIWRERFEDITAMERYLARNGTVILKFFLNVSKKEQRERFLERLEEPSKNWKFSMGDITEGGVPGYRPAHLDGGGAVVRGAGRPQMVRPSRDRFSHRQHARQARPAFPEGRQGRAGRIQAGARGAAGRRQGREGGHKKVGWAKAPLRRAHHLSTYRYLKWWARLAHPTDLHSVPATLQAILPVDRVRIGLWKQPAFRLGQVQTDASGRAAGRQELPEILHMGQRLNFLRKLLERDQGGGERLRHHPLVMAGNPLL